jgi:hypothetical protein
MDGAMARKRHKPEKIIAKLRQVDVLTGHTSRSEAESRRDGAGYSLGDILQHLHAAGAGIQLTA